MTVETPIFVPLDFQRRAPEEMTARAGAFRDLMWRRRSVRYFSPDPVPWALVETAVRTAQSAPSGAHRQPWHFVIVDNADLKRQIRIAAEHEEKESYENRMNAEWLEALARLGTDWRKEFLEIAPYLVIVFKESFGRDEHGTKVTNYYVNESVGIACGLFIAAIHNMGLVTLTHTPSPMGFLSELLHRPPNEKPYILFPVGYPAPDAVVPDLERKAFDEVVQWNAG